MLDLGTLAALALASYRVTHLLVVEDGPWAVIDWLRYQCSRVGLDELVACPWCLSIWVSALLVLLVTREPAPYVLLTLATSGGAMLIWRLVDGPFTHQREAGSG